MRALRKRPSERFDDRRPTARGFGGDHNSGPCERRRSRTHCDCADRRRCDERSAACDRLSGERRLRVRDAGLHLLRPLCSQVRPRARQPACSSCGGARSCRICFRKCWRRADRVGPDWFGLRVDQSGGLGAAESACASREAQSDFLPEANRCSLWRHSGGAGSAGRCCRIGLAAGTLDCGVSGVGCRGRARSGAIDLGRRNRPSAAAPGQYARGA